MSDRQETVADVLTKMRNFACVGKGHEGTCSDLIESYADRIEAAWEREDCSRRGAESQSGNAAAMREAVEYASRVLAKWRRDAPFSAWNEYGEAIDKCRAALAAPPRNCDMYDKEEVRMAYHLHGDGLMTMQAVVDWLYATAKEGATDGSK